jgi:hypothetical protein
MVKQFWDEQPFKLEIPDISGNCTKCFLKDEGDLAQLMLEQPEDNQWWLDLQDKYGDFRQGGTSYRQILAEAPTRMLIRDALISGQTLVCPGGFDPRRFTLITRQEERLLREGRKAFACSCERVGILDVTTMEV